MFEREAMGCGAVLLEGPSDSGETRRRGTRTWGNNNYRCCGARMKAVTQENRKDQPVTWGTELSEVIQGGEAFLRNGEGEGE